MKKKLFNGMMTVLGFMVLACCVLMGNTAKASAAIKCYTISSGNTTVYSNTGLTSRYGTIFGSDEITVLQVTDRYCKVTYPVSRGTKTGYISTGSILTKTMGSTYNSRGNITTFKRPGGASYGYVAVNDAVKVLGTYGSYTQVKYPAGGGYKYAFVTTANANSYLFPSNSNTSSNNGAAVSDGVYKIVSALGDSYVWDICGGSTADGGNVQIYEYGGTTNQQFQFTRQSDGYYTIKNVKSGKLVECYASGRTNGTNIQQYSDYNTDNQRWRLLDAGNGYYYLQCKCNGLVADINGGNAYDESNIIMHEIHYGANQKFKLVSVGTSSGNNSAGTNYTTQTVQITSYGQTVDTFNGVAARYIPGIGNSNTGTYCCARYVSNYYKTIYGVTVGNMFTGRTPSADNGYFYVTNAPKAGDIGYQLNSGNSGHWFIIKAVNNDGTYTIIEQNWKSKSNGKTYCTRNRKVSYAGTKGFKVFRWSKRMD